MLNAPSRTTNSTSGTTSSVEAARLGPSFWSSRTRIHAVLTSGEPSPSCGAPTRQFSRQHDIYALGVVLLEIGLWKTISRLFESRLQEGQRTGKLPKPRDVTAAWTALAKRVPPAGSTSTSRHSRLALPGDRGPPGIFTHEQPSLWFHEGTDDIHSSSNSVTGLPDA
ncbi:hypothetical protein BO71DRAFT_480692 [Aspergillus ellipticus CBS 707.79]|uniref:Protein kinase domain-containing protein n=1 Tax=Aspergillus ellipticus CBS 707.79 TaxID=1448320 RepID=A0A319DKR4_9EURO|nr:hypothetical protein BO71DRAFT_480692 [Aspergillus ellipticus CBS 707.79]